MGAYRPWQPPSHSRVKPAGSVNDVGLDALDLDRMKQVRAGGQSAGWGLALIQWVSYLTATKAGT